MKLTFANRVYGSLFGLFVGDALGAPVEFKKRGSYSHHTKYLSGGEFNLAPGQWTDDTSLALCIIDSIITTKKFDLKNQIEHFIRWWKFGENSSTGFCFDIGNTTKKGLQRYLDFGNPLGGSELDPATNGAIMRLSPVPLFFRNSLNDSIKNSILQTQTTHGALESIEASVILAYVIYFILEEKSKEEILKFTHLEYKLMTSINDLKDGKYKNKSESEINGNGLAYNTLEAALYAFYKFNNFIDGLIFVVNLGDDTDTVGAVYGQIAGAYYGIQSIPDYYLENLYAREHLENKVRNFLEIIDD